MKRKIPVDKYGWINYNKFNKQDEEGSVYIIEINPKGTSGRYQYNGVGCYQGEVTGFLAHKFQSDNQYFNKDHWYKSTCWGDNYPKDIVFENDICRKIMDQINYSMPEKEFDAKLEEVDEQLTQYGIPAKSILEEIMQEVKSKTGIVTWTCDALNNESSFNKKWFEAHIIIKNDHKKYLLTWMNCD